MIRCGECGEHAPLVGELLSDLSQQLVAFSGRHSHGAGSLIVDPAPELIVLEGEAAERVAAESAA